jgi:hypothetical protein
VGIWEQKMKKALIAVLLLSCLAGCQSMDRNGLIAAGYTEEYADGYVDGYSAGCNAVGHPLAEYKRDHTRYEQDHQYKKGWNDGFTIARCDYAAVW